MTVVAQHVHRDGDRWGVTVRELIQAAVDEGRPVRLHWNEAGTEWDWPGNEFHTIVMPAVSEQLLADHNRWSGQAG
ncbi:hypothetical protein [Lentzea jiangxiensis]|uniref:Uncharacterized protein n=1 Tax=Lentzea jiangxiensis TaxID=641025 RepID=A0A1H0JZK0_9PSEU|nr:hypothetical protein [Lentzea jiangxiensis]SDO49084.1 hypothetical protein SAMN05421507_102699 [Lentzea jiangxiensis]